MKRLTLEATDENVLKALRQNEYNRNEDIKHFIEALDLLDGNAFISLDGKWGEGKTFYVRQIEKTLEFLRKNKLGYTDGETDTLKEIFKGTELGELGINKTFFPIYYNAWLYDNHNDPLLSLVYNILKKTKDYWSSAEKDKTIKEQLVKLVSAVNLSIGKNVFGVEIQGEQLANVFKKEDIFEEIKLAEEIRDLVKEIFNNIIVEQGERLVIFVDELDRCRPGFAIEMLERMKHYFDDERLIFVATVNKKQLVHTISNYYGQEFDSSGYLNKFFDFNINMPVINNNQKVITSFKDGSYIIGRMMNALNDYFELSLRDSIIFKQRCIEVSSYLVCDYDVQGFYLSIFVPILLILDIVNQDMKRKFLEGDIENMDDWIRNMPEFSEVAVRLAEDRSRTDNDYLLSQGINKINEVYHFAFKNNGKNKCLDGRVYECRNIKSLCVKICNGFKLG